MPYLAQKRMYVKWTIPQFKLALVSLTKEQSVPPMGLAYLATYLREHMNLQEIKIIDASYENPWTGLQRYKPDIVGISAMTVQYNNATDLCKLIKKKMGIPAIVGGVHVSTCPQSLARDFDVGVIGEGEETLLELLQSFNLHHSLNYDDLESIKGLVFWRTNKLVFTGRRDLIEPLDRIPVPDRAYLNSKYFLPRPIFTLQGEIGRYGNLFTSRGCPYKCIFCSTSIFWKRTRLHSAQHVFLEIRHLVEKYNITFIDISDDLFTIKKDRVRELSVELGTSGILGRVRFSCQARANLIDEELCQILREMGVVTIGLGFESGSSKILRFLKRGSVTTEHNRTAILLAKKYGLRIQGSLMFGSPGETLEDMKETLNLLDFMLDAHVDNVWYFITTPFPGTRLWELAKERKLIKDEVDWNVFDLTKINSPLFLDSNISIEDFWYILAEAEKRCRKLKPPISTKVKIRLLFTTSLKRAILNPRRAARIIFRRYFLREDYVEL